MNMNPKLKDNTEDMAAAGGLFLLGENGKDAFVRKIDDYTVVLRFSSEDNGQAPLIVREMLINSYAEGLFSR